MSFFGHDGRLLSLCYSCIACGCQLILQLQLLHNVLEKQSGISAT